MRFAFELCRELGYPHPDYLFADLSHRQFQDWQILWEIEPFGEYRADMRMARAASAYLHGKVEEHKLMFQFHRPFHRPTPKSPDEYKRKAMHAWANAGGGIRLG